MADFSSYGGASETWRAIEADMPPFNSSRSPTETRAAVNAWREKTAADGMAGGLAAQVHMSDHAIPARDQDGAPAVEARLYWPASRPRDAGSPAAPVYVHLHGGGWLYGTLASEDAICATLAARTGIAVLNVNYRHTPEHVFPAAWHDVQDALVWLTSRPVAAALHVDPARVVIGGVSAGAHLAASIVLEQRLGRWATASTTGLQDVPPLAGQVLMVPMLAAPGCHGPQWARLADPAASSCLENAHATTLSAASIAFFMDLLHLPQPPDPADTRLSPGNASPAQARGLPPSVFGLCGLDPLRDEGLLYAKQLAEAGVPTKITLFKGVPHGFRRYGEHMAAAKAWDALMEQGILWALSQPAATGRFDVVVSDGDK